MKNNMLIFLSIMILILVADIKAQGGNQSQTVPLSASHTRLMPLWFDFDAIDYVNGGITFSYPGTAFTTTPRVIIAIHLKNAVYSPLESFVAEVTANSTAATTVRVNKVIGGVSSEAATNDVTVHLYAIGDNN